MTSDAHASGTCRELWYPIPGSRNSRVSIKFDPSRWDEGYITNIANCLIRRGSHLLVVTLRARFAAIRRMIAWLEQTRSDNLTSYLTEATGSEVSSMLKMYFGYLEAGQGDDLTKFEYAKTVAQAFQTLALEKLIPAHISPRPPASVVKKLRIPRKKKALADLPQLYDEPAVSTILKQITENDDSENAARVMREQLRGQYSNVVMEVRTINSSRLMRARDAYSAVFEAKWQDYELARRAIAAAGGWPESITRDLLDVHAMRPGPYFGLSLESLGLLIILIDAIGLGLPQSRKDEQCRKEFKYFTK